MAANQDLNIVVKLVDQASGELKRLSGSLDSFGDKVKDNTEGARKFTTVMAGAATLIGGLAIKEFMTFEKTMSGIKAVLSPTAQEFEALGDKAKQLWKDTIYSQDEVAQSLEMLAKNGLNATDILNGAAEATVNLAAAAGTDLSTAADLATDVMAIFGIEAANMSKAINGISGVAVASKFTVDDYALALAQGGWVAKAVWVNFDDFNASIAAISPLFASGSDAGTSFKVFLQRLVPASNAAAAAMDDLGLLAADGSSKFFDAAGNLRSMGEISGLLSKSLTGLSDAQKNAALQTIFGTDAMRAAVGLAETGADAFADLNEQIQGVDAAQQAAVRLDNLAGSFEALKGTISVIMVDIGERLAPVIRGAIDALTATLGDLQRAWNNLSPAMQTTITVIGAVAAVLAGLTVAVWAIGFVLPAIIAGFSTLTAVLGFLLSPVGLVIAGIAALAIAWKTNFLGIQEATAAVIEAIKPLFESIVEGAKQLFNGVSEWVGRVKEPFMQIVEFLKPFIEEYLNNFLEFFKSTFENLITFLTGAWEIVKGIIEIALSLIGGIIEIALNLLTGDWEWAWNALVEMTAGIWEGLKSIIDWVITIIAAIIKQFLDTMSLLFKNTWTAIKLFLAGVWEAIKTIFTDSINLVSTIIQKGGELIKSAWDGTMSAIKNVTLSVWDGIKSTIANGINWVVDKLNWLIEKANSISSAVPGVPTIPLIPKLAFQNGGIVPGFQTGGIVAGGVNPANHDQVPAMLDPGELILNRAQQKNISAQLNTWGGQAVVINLTIGNNNFYGDDEGFIEKIGNTIVDKVKQNLAINAF